MKIKINNKIYDEFNGLSVTTSLDTVASTFAFSGRYDKKNDYHKELFLPLSFHPVELINDSGVTFLTGQIISHNFNSESNPDLVVFAGYSNGGVLEDCTIPEVGFPLESLNLSLKQITEKILKYFPGVGLRIDTLVASDCNLPYIKSVAEPEGSVKDYLSKLAAQRNIVMGHDIHGNITYFRPNPNSASKGFYNKENTLKMSLDVNGQGMHSDLSVIRQPSKKNTGESSKSDRIKNPLIKRFRPSVKILTSGADGETQKGVKSSLAEELKNIQLNMTFDKWEPLYVGDMIDVQNDEVFINKRFKFMVNSTSISQDESGRIMTVSAVLPECFTGEVPKNPFKF